uniref:CSON009477 protein n=1 Tax=Culicoides sonorensis TaxID=179676 RepID=A0A336M5R9_CULSO
MAKFYENCTIFNYSWDQVAQAFWRKYPNPYSSHVLTEDTLCREITRDGKLHSKRLLTKTNRVPKWGERFFKAKFVCIVEESIVDPKNKTIVTYTRNIGFNKIMNVVEKVTYKISNDAAGKTIALRSAWIDSQVYGFGAAIKAFGLDRFKKNCAKTVLGFNHVLHHMFPAVVITQKDVNVSTNKIKEAAKTAAEQIYQAYSVKN